MITYKPFALCPGDTIRVVSPASPIEPNETEAGIALLEQAGFRVEVGDHAFDRTGYFAGADADRADDLMRAFLDPKVNAVICSRGGYGCPRLIPRLDLHAMARSGKMFPGFSDITTIHVALNKAGLATLYSPMVGSFSTPRADWVKQSFLNALAGADPFDVDYPPGTCLVPGVAEGLSAGGCLVPFMDSLATPHEIETDGCVLIIEDVGEKPHRVDALFTHLIRSGKIQRCAGIVIGEMTGTDDMIPRNEAGEPIEGYRNVTWRTIVTERIRPLGIPTVIDFPVGHIPNMLTVPLGVRVRIDAEAGTMNLREPICQEQ